MTLSKSVAAAIEHPSLPFTPCSGTDQAIHSFRHYAIYRTQYWDAENVESKEC